MGKSKTDVTAKQALYALDLARKVIASYNGKIGGKSRSQAKLESVKRNLEKANAAKKLKLKTFAANDNNKTQEIL